MIDLFLKVTQHGKYSPRHVCQKQQNKRVIREQQDTLSQYNSLSEKKLLSLGFIDINQNGMETGHAFDMTLTLTIKNKLYGKSNFDR